MKVVRMLQDMATELQKELEDDKQVHEMLTCWCETNEKEKTAAIEMGTQKIDQLKASMDEAIAKITAMKEKRAATMDEINADHKSLTEANALRMKENKEYQAASSDLMEAVAAAKQAVVVLSKHNPDFAQVQAAVQKLQGVRAAQQVLKGNSLRRDQLDTLKAFLQQPSGSSFLAIPGFKSYAPQSGQIFGVLKQMQEDFEKDLSESEAAEKKAQEAYESLKAAKEEEIAAGKAAVVQLDQDIAEFSEKHAQELKELDNTEKQLALDQEFLANLKKTCSASGAEFDQRVKDRTEEIVAVDDTIKILNDDSAYDVFDKSVNAAFLQTASMSKEEEKDRRSRASAVLRQAADQTGIPQLALLATTAQLDAFTKVKAEIDKLVAELGKQQADEVAQRDWCIDEFAKNDRETAAADDKKNALVTKIADLNQTITTLTADIESATSAIAEMENQMKRASETREADNAEYQTTVADQRLTQMILAKATDRMKAVYALLQQQPGAAHIATSGNHTNAGNGPAAFKEYEQNAGGDRVIAMLEEVIADSKKTENDAIASEEDSQTAYENFMQDSNKSIKQYQESIASMTESRAKAKESMSMAKTDLKQTVVKLSDLNDMSGDLHQSCDYVIKNFDARQAARAAEMDALNEAKAILSGMK